MDPAAALAELADRAPLLVASDYDGTLAPIVEDPARAFPDARALAALVALGRLPDTRAALLSGRGRDDLARLSGAPEHVLLVGSHGAEPGGAPELSPDERALRERLVAELRRLVPSDRGFLIEEKPAGAAFHYRNAAPEEAAGVLARVRALGEELRLHPRPGKKVLELAVLGADKGAALRRLRAETGAVAVLFLGDDVTDEDGFAALAPGDCGVKVGDSATRARVRVAGQGDVAPLLERLLALRSGRA